MWLTRKPKLIIAIKMRLTGKLKLIIAIKV